jgi:endo-alpha-1,4-polygalactosaminidase (GH114 family)
MTGKKYFLLNWNILILTSLFKFIVTEYSNFENFNGFNFIDKIKIFSNPNDKIINYRSLQSKQINLNSTGIIYIK